MNVSKNIRISLMMVIIKAGIGSHAKADLAVQRNDIRTGIIHVIDVTVIDIESALTVVVEVEVGVIVEIGIGIRVDTLIEAEIGVETGMEIGIGIETAIGTTEIAITVETETGIVEETVAIATTAAATVAIAPIAIVKSIVLPLHLMNRRSITIVVTVIEAAAKVQVNNTLLL